jgi:hypothetical protein
MILALWNGGNVAEIDGAGEVLRLGGITDPGIAVGNTRFGRPIPNRLSTVGRFWERSGDRSFGRSQARSDRPETGRTPHGGPNCATGTGI